MPSASHVAPDTIVVSTNVRIAAATAQFPISNANYTFGVFPSPRIMPQSTPLHRHVLVRCEVVNRDRAASVRFIEQDHFRLWQYMMANKHDLIVQSAVACLWLPEAEYAANAAIFDNAGTCEAVTRLTFAVYDRVSGLCNTLQRFVPIAETDQLSDLLLRRISPDVRASDDFAMEQQRGYAVIKSGADTTRFDLALEP